VGVRRSNVSQTEYLPGHERCLCATAGSTAYLGDLLVFLFHMCDAVGPIDNGPVAALERPLPLLALQRLSTTFNTVQRPSTPEGLAVLKRVEHLSAVTFRISLEGRSTRSGGRELLCVKRSVRVHAFTCPR
jgi:hypothetical protein